MPQILLSVLLIFIMCSSQAQSLNDLAKVRYKTVPTYNEQKEKVFQGFPPYEHISLVIKEDPQTGQQLSMGYKMKDAYIGPYSCWDREGNLQYKGQYKTGQKHGTWMHYHSNGELRKEENYRQGERNGRWSFYFENGQLRETSHYKAGKREGRFQMYNEAGTLLTEGFYKDGQKVGLWKEFHANGQLAISAAFNNGLAHGRVINYDKNGFKTREAFFTNGELSEGSQQIKLLPNETEDQ